MTVQSIRKTLGLQTGRLRRIFEMMNPYNKISSTIWKDKIVFDIAPDVGVTPNYFLKFGAKRIVAYANKKAQIQDQRVEWNGKFYIYDILFKFSDEDINDSVLVMDCDGYEHVVKPDKLVSLFPLWAIKIHASNLEYDTWFDTLSQKGHLISNRRKTKMFTNLPLR